MTAEATKPPVRFGPAGLIDDVKRRGRSYASDWRDGLHGKVPAASAFLFFACLAPAIAFGGMMSLATDGAIGVLEMVAATAGCGVAYAIFSGQPLTILGGTGPLLVFTTLLFGLAESFELPFLSIYAWVGLWAALFTVAAAFAGISRLIGYFTRFTDEIFAALISLIFIVQAVQSVLAGFPAKSVADDAALFGVILALGTYTVASALARLRRTPFLRGRLREVIADFGPAIAVLSMVGLRQLLPGVEVPQLAVPAAFTTTSGRPWLIALFDIPLWAIFACAVPALLVALLVFLDQNITVRIVQSPDNQLKKGDAYHWDLAVVGGLLGVCSLFGLPWLVAATVRSVNHVKALAVSGPNPGTVENRVSPLLIHALIGLSLLATSWLREIPMAVLYGLFLYMGIASMRGNQLFERLRLWLTDPELLPPHHYVRRVPIKTIHIFTAVQLACLVALWLVKSSPFGILFPLLIALLVPVQRALARWMPAEHMAALDAEETVEEAEDDLVS